MKTTIVAEIGSNWEGSITKAKKIIHECKKAGANAVKFQMWRAEDLYTRSHPNWKNIKKSELTFDKVRKIKEYSDKEGIEFFCSAFYPDGVKFLISIGVKKFKIASRTCKFTDPNSLEILQEKARSKKEVFISMGMGGNKQKIKNIFKKNNITLCYCISKYPTKFNEIDWKKAIKYDGFSDHSLGIDAPFLFTLLKKQTSTKQITIEKHVKLKNSRGPDASTSITTDELKELTYRIRAIEKFRIKKC